MKKLFLMAVVMAGLGTLSWVALPLAHADKKEDPKDKSEPAAKPTEADLNREQFATATALVDFGRRTKSAEALAVAALMIAKTQFDDVELPKEKQEGVEVTKFDPKDEANKLLAEAKKIDPKGKAVAEIAEKVADLHRDTSRAPVGGVKTFKISLANGAAWNYSATYPPNTTQSIGIAYFSRPSVAQIRLSDPTRPGDQQHHFVPGLLWKSPLQPHLLLVFQRWGLGKGQHLTVQR